MYIVCENGKEASDFYSSSWGNARFDTLPEAQEYAEKWLGIYHNGKTLKLNEEYDYSGYGDIVTIKEVP